MPIPRTVLLALHIEKVRERSMLLVRKLRRRWHPTLPCQFPPELDPANAPLPAVIPAADVLTVEYLIWEWLDDVRGRVRPRTYLSYEQMARLHILPVLGPWRVDRLDVRTVETFYQWKYQSGLSPRSVQYVRAILRQAFAEAIRWGWLSTNLAGLARGPKAERPRFDVLPREEARRLLCSFEQHRYGPLFITILGLGLRIGEALGLRWCDVRLPNNKRIEEIGQVTLRTQLQRIGRHCELVAPKSRSSIRALSLPSFVAAALAQRLDEQRSERLEAGRQWRNELGLVFTNRVGAPLDDSRIRQRFREHLAGHDFDQMRIHDLRHLCASLLLAEGVQPRVLMEILGHSQINLTLDTYAHVMPSAYQESAEAMERAMNRERPS